MPWWVWLWFAAISYLMVASVFEDVTEGVAAWKLLLDVLQHILTLLFVLSYFLSPIHPTLAQIFIPAVILCVAWATKRSVEDLRKLLPDSELSSSENRWVAILGASVAVIFLVPAWILGLIVGIRGWIGETV